jgi:hypothetical protein
MRELNLCYKPGTGPRTIPTSNTITLLSSKFLGGSLIPKLERLTWNISHMPTLLTAFPLFLSPSLKHVTLYTDPETQLRDDQPKKLVKMISLLPPSLEHLSIMCYDLGDNSLEDAISSLVLRCGPSLTSFGTCVGLSVAAICHLIQLPHLSSLVTCQGPPSAIPIPIFPSLEHLQLDVPGGLPPGVQTKALQWPEVIVSHQGHILQSGSRLSTPHTNPVYQLKSLRYPGATTVDSEFMSSVVNFRNLVTLCVDMVCSYDKCRFRLTDNDLENLATTLPLLQCLRLGKPCIPDTCENTVVSLALLSVHCPDLEVLEIHCATREIVSDMQNLLENRNLYEGPKCKVRGVIVGDLSFRLPKVSREDDEETVMRGFKFIFPDLVQLRDLEDCYVGRSRKFYM